MSNARTTSLDIMETAAGAESVEISRENDLDRGRLNAEIGQAGRGAGQDIIPPQQLDLIAGQGRAPAAARPNRPETPRRPREIETSKRLASIPVSTICINFTETINAWPAQLIGPAESVGTVERRHDGVGGVPDINRLKTGQTRRRSAAGPG